MPTRAEINFASGGNTLRGWLERPADAAGPLPVVVMAHGLGGVKEWLSDVSSAIADAGFACLAYDHPHYGASDGEPRQHVDPSAQVRAYRDAVSYAQTLREVDPRRVALWGTSLAGGLVLVVGAVDARVRAVVSQVPLVDPWTTLRRMLPESAVPRLLESVRADRAARYRGAEPAVIPLAADGGGALPDPRTHAHIAKMAARTPTFRNEITLASIDLLMEFAPYAFVERVSPCPLLMTVASHDALCPTDLALAAFDRAREPKQIHLLPGDHYTAYEERFKEAVGRQIEFLQANL